MRHRYARCCRPAGVKGHITCKGIALEPGRSRVWPPDVTRSSPHYGGEGILIHPPHQGVCGRHGTEDQGVTPGELPGSSGGTEGSGSISESERSSGALEVVGRLGSTTS